MTNVDDDTAGITVSAISGATTEGGGTATFTIVLNSEPTANVTIGVSSNDTTEGTVSPSTTWTSNPQTSKLGSLTVSYTSGASIDITTALKSGKMAAYVELRDGAPVSADELVAHCKSLLASYKVPREVHFRSEALPRNATGKVDRGKFLKSVRGEG
mgnify:CR=1 FL=1